MKSWLRYSLRSISAFLVCHFMMVMTCFADVAVIVHAGSAIDSLTDLQVKSIFLGKKLEFPDGSPASPVDIQEGNSIRIEFYKNIINMSEESLTKYWAKQTFSGNTIPSKQVKDTKSVLEEVARDGSAIGYVDISEVNPSVKVVLIK